jgi:fibronectin type 3 domain-containing protein
MKNPILLTLVAILLGVMAIPARAFTHPCIPNTLQELDTIKANLDKDPWKAGYTALAADGRSRLTYVMGGPFEVVKRNPNENLWPWRGDMIAVYNLSRMWYFTGNEAYAKKARDILVAWAQTHKTFGGNESGLDLGDYAICYGGGASILRGTWPGWTQQDTITVQNYFRNVLWRSTAAQFNISGPANKGSLNVVAGAVMAVFCDDTEMFNHVVDVFRNYPGAGLPNILATGQMGETGRDIGHGFNDLYARTLTAEILWKQGVDVFSEIDNRLLAAGEYHARNTSTWDTPFVPYGTVDYHYYQNAAWLVSQNRGAYYLLQNAYRNRFGLPTPWIDRKIQEASVDSGNFMFARTVDFSTATRPPADPRPPVSPASSGLTLTTLGGQTAGRSASYADGVWTVTGLGSGAWTDGADDGQFVYKEMTGDCAMVAQVTSVTFSGSQNGKMGLMVRDNLVGTISQRSWTAIVPTASNGNLIEAHARGWTVTWGGKNWAARAQGLPLPLPYWLKMERKGNVITSYASQDGTSWSPTISSDYGNLPSTVYVGLFVSSGNTTPNTATFANLSYTGGTGGLVTTPAAPAAVLASGSNKAITVRWLPSFGSTAYDLLRSTTSGSGYTVIASDLGTDKTSYVDTNVVPGTTYYYVARAKNSAGTSGNSPEFYAALLPVPLINLAFEGTASDSGNSAATNTASAFDQNFGSFWFHGGTTGWLQYDFGVNSAQVIKRYTMVSATLIPARDPKDWQFQGSHDGTTWTTLDTQINQTFEFRAYQRAFDIGNTTAYRYYRLNVTANNGDGAFLHLSELGLWGDSGRVVQSGTYAIASRNSNNVMDVTSVTDGAPVVQQTFDGEDSQQWALAWQGNGCYRATNVAATKALDNSGSSSPGENLVIQPSSGATSQLWKLTPDGDGFYRIESENSGLVADVSGGSTADGANIIQGTYSGGYSQQWMPGLANAPQPTPPTPASLQGMAVSISQINLSWTASPGAVSYRIKRSAVTGGPYATIAAGANGTSYSDSNLNSSTTYYYVLSALNGSGESVDSAAIGVTTLTGPPAAPTGLSAILGTNQVTLSWMPTSGTTSYGVKRGTTSGGPYTTTATGLTSTTYTDTDVSHDTTYYYVVVATNGDGTGPDSAEIAMGPGTLSVHLKFDETGGTIAADSSGGGHHATLVNGANFAPGILDNGLNLPATSSQHATLPSGIVSGLTDFTVATWIKVNAFTTWQRIFDFGTGTNNNMFLSAQGPAGAGRPRFSIRTPSTAEQTIDSSIALTTGVWTHIAVTRSGNTVSIYINGSLAGSGNVTLSPADLGFTTQNYLGKSQFPDAYLNSTLDDFRIYAQAMSPAELTALTTLPAGAPRQLAAVPGDAHVTLTWSPNATTSYTVKRSATSGGPYTIIAEGVTDHTYIDTGLTNGTTYYYVIGGANAGGPGPDSAEIAVTPGALGLHLKLDETTGSTASDSSGNNRNGTTFNSPTWTVGRIGNALSFNGTNQYATLPNGVVSDLQDFTITTWVYWNGGNNWQRIFDFGSGTSTYMFLSPKNAANGRLRFAITTSGGGGERIIDSNAVLPSGGWTHIAVTLSGTTGTLYVNGQQVGQNTAITLRPADLGMTTQNRIGRSQFNDPYFNGSVDDFRLYPSALGASGIASLAAPMQTTDLTATGGTGQIGLAWSPTMNATSYTVRRASVSGGVYTTVASGLTSTNHIDTGLADGTAYYYVITPANLSGEGANSAEVSAITLPAAPENVTATAVNGQVLISWSASASAESYDVLRATNIDGPYTTLASDLTETSQVDTTALPGRTYHYTVAAVNSSGQSQSSVTATITMPTLAVSWLKLDETSGATAADATGNNNSGTLVNSPSWTGGRIGNALNLNGTNQYLTLPNSVTSNLQDFTIATWVYWNGGNNWQRIFDFGSGTSTYMFLSPKNGANNNLRFAITTSGGGGEQKIDSNATLPSGGWHHVAVTLSGSTGTLYVNGQQVGQNTAMTLRPANLGVTTQNRIGRSQYNDPYFNGRIDDFRLYAGALSASDIAALAAPIQTTGLVATSGAGQIDLTWNSTLNATSYILRRASTSGGAYTTVAHGLTGTSHADTGLAGGTTYHYVVTPADVSGDGANSNEATGTSLSEIEGWRLTHFGTTADSGNAAASADPDGDGWTNSQEFISGTDPNDSSSVLKVAQMQTSGNDFQISFPSVSGKTYRLERSDTLLEASWMIVQENIAGTGGIVQIADPVAALQTRRFYRIVVVP